MPFVLLGASFWGCAGAFLRTTDGLLRAETVGQLLRMHARVPPGLSMLSAECVLSVCIPRFIPLSHVAVTMTEPVKAVSTGARMMTRVIRTQVATSLRTAG